jgi:hypothetical protein
VRADSISSGAWPKATPARALRALKRRLSRVVFQSLRADRGLRAQAWPIVGSDPAAQTPSFGAGNSARSWV